MPAHIVAARARITAFCMKGGFVRTFQRNGRAESRNGRVRVHGRALYKQASTQSLQTLAFTDNSFLGLKYTCH